MPRKARVILKDTAHHIVQRRQPPEPALPDPILRGCNPHQHRDLPVQHARQPLFMLRTARVMQVISLLDGFD